MNPYKTVDYNNMVILLNISLVILGLFLCIALLVGVSFDRFVVILNRFVVSVGLRMGLEILFWGCFMKSYCQMLCYLSGMYYFSYSAMLFLLRLIYLFEDHQKLAFPHFLPQQIWFHFWVNLFLLSIVQLLPFHMLWMSRSINELPSNVALMFCGNFLFSFWKIGHIFYEYCFFLMGSCMFRIKDWLLGNILGFYHWH